jgi:pilus assembly protein CpaB
MNTKAFIPLAVAIVLGGMAAKVGYTMLNKKPVVKETKVTVNVTQVASAKDYIPAGTAIKPEMIQMVSVPVEQVQPNAVRELPKLLTRVPTIGIQKDQQIAENMLAPVGSTAGIGALVPNGQRAMTLEINEISGVGGMLMPGCFVDIVTTFSDKSGQMLSKTLIRNLRVLAVGKRISEPKDPKADPNAPEPPPARTVTLEVSPHQAEMIDLASHVGTPRLTLRGSRDQKDDVNSTESRGVTLADIRGAGDDSNASSFLTRLVEIVAKNSTTPKPSLFNNSEPTTKPSQELNSHMVQIIRGGKESNVQIDQKLEEKSQVTNIKD